MSTVFACVACTTVRRVPLRRLTVATVYPHRRAALTGAVPSDPIMPKNQSPLLSLMNQHLVQELSRFKCVSAALRLPPAVCHRDEMCLCVLPLRPVPIRVCVSRSAVGAMAGTRLGGLCSRLAPSPSPLPSPVPPFPLRVCLQCIKTWAQKAARRPP